MLHWQRNTYAALTLGTALLAVLFRFKLDMEATLILAVFSLVSLAFLLGRGRMCAAAQLILDNKILVIPNVVIHTEQGVRVADETIVSAFGLLVAGKVYVWGNHGLTGPRLRTVEADRLHIRLCFGDFHRITEVQLAHGLVDEDALQKVLFLLWRETGVQAKVIGR